MLPFYGTSISINIKDFTKRFYLFLSLQELVSLKPCKAAELVATHFSEQIETVIKKLQVNIAKTFGEETSSGETTIE